MSLVPITGFQREYRWLSNFHPCEIVYDGIIYNCTECAYQAQKTLCEKTRLEISKMTPGTAKVFSRGIDIREDWDNIKYDIMESLNFTKYTKHAELRNKLLATGNRDIIEGNTWGDTYWGVVDGVGENNLGKILMAIRGIIKTTFTA